MLSNSLIELDRQHLVHPVISWREHEARGATVLESAHGCWLRDASGNEILDGFAGLWCVNVGYGQDTIVDVAAEQMRRLPYATGYFHYASEPSIKLAAELADLTPGDLNHIYFSLGGSDAVDTAIKMVRFYFNALGKTDKKHFISLERGYHGSSSLGSGLTALPVVHDGFDLPRPWQHYISSPYTYRHPSGSTGSELIAASVHELRAKVEELGSDSVAAFIAEPVQGSGGVIVPPTGWLNAMYEACLDLGILFITDEVITGFGRTGPMFACEHEDVAPDIMTMAKGLTAGYVPMGAVALSDSVYETIADGQKTGVPFGHGQTYSGHPVSAAVALEVLRLYREGGVLENGQASGAYFEKELALLVDHPLVGDVRAHGLLAGIELVTDKEAKTKPAADLLIPQRLFERGYANGLTFRAFADSIIGLAPPLTISRDEIDILIARLRKTLNELLDVKEIRDALN